MPVQHQLITPTGLVIAGAVVDFPDGRGARESEELEHFAGVDVGAIGGFVLASV